MRDTVAVMAIMARAVLARSSESRWRSSVSCLPPARPLVGSQRTELIKTMVEQSNKWGIYQAESTKFRVIEADGEILHAINT